MSDIAAGASFAFSGRVLIQPSNSLIDPARSDHAVLSQDPCEHLQHLRQSDSPPFDQTGDHAHILEDRPGPRRRFLRYRKSWRRGRDRCLWALGILLALLLLATLILVISRAALAGLTLAMSFPTSERTAQIPAPGIPRVREKEDPTVPATSPAPAQLRLVPNNRSQQHVTREDQSDYRAAPIPIRDKPKMLPDRY